MCQAIIESLHQSIGVIINRTEALGLAVIDSLHQSIGTIKNKGMPSDRQSSPKFRGQKVSKTKAPGLAVIDSLPHNVPRLFRQAPLVGRLSAREHFPSHVQLQQKPHTINSCFRYFFLCIYHYFINSLLEKECYNQLLFLLFFLCM